jgi:hypothetical protein
MSAETHDVAFTLLAVGCCLTLGLARSRETGDRSRRSYSGSRGALFQRARQGDDAATDLMLVESGEAKQ